MQYTTTFQHATTGPHSVPHCVCVRVCACVSVKHRQFMCVHQPVPWPAQGKRQRKDTHLDTSVHVYPSTVVTSRGASRGLKPNTGVDGTCDDDSCVVVTDVVVGDVVVADVDDDDLAEPSITFASASASEHLIASTSTPTPQISMSERSQRSTAALSELSQRSSETSLKLGALLRNSDAENEQGGEPQAKKKQRSAKRTQHSMMRGTTFKGRKKKAKEKKGEVVGDAFLVQASRVPASPPPGLSPVHSRRRDVSPELHAVQQPIPNSDDDFEDTESSQTEIMAEAKDTKGTGVGQVGQVL